MGQYDTDIYNEGMGWQQQQGPADEDQQQGRWSPQDDHRNEDRDRQQHHTTKTTMVVAHDKGDNEDGTRTEGTGNGDSTITKRNNKKGPKEMLMMSLWS